MSIPRVAAILVTLSALSSAQVAPSRLDPARHAFAGYVLDADGEPVAGKQGDK